MSRAVASFVLAVLTSLLILGTSVSNAQPITSRYGVDSVSCVTNLALYRELYKQKNYKEAIIPWRYVFNNCPRATENIFINGANMFNSFIVDEKESSKKQKLIDTLLLIYDSRIKYWGNEAKLLAGKANDLLNADTSRSYEAYGMLKRSVGLLKNTSEETTLRNYCSAAITSFKSGKLQSEALIEVYNQADSVIDAHLSSSAGNEERLRWRQLKKVIDINMLPLFQCNELSVIFKPRLKARGEDPDLLKQVSDMLFHRGCTEDTLYLFSLEKMNKLRPDVNTAFLIARQYMKLKDTVRALQTLNNVADKLKDDDSKAMCSYYLGAVYVDSKDFINARANALKAIKLKPTYGEPYVMIAECYAQSALECGKDNITSRAAFWCAVDKLEQAKKVDPKLTSIADTLIGRYSRSFPSVEMLLAGKLKIGSKYLVECWINETTTVRSKPGIKK